MRLAESTCEATNAARQDVERAAKAALVDIERAALAALAQF